MGKDKNINNQLISVIIPAYNAEKHIEQSINSILNQTYSNLELIIVNDGSTDKTKQIILEYKDNRIKFIDLKNNTGLINALNIGIEHAAGEYIARHDADDIAMKNRLSVQLDFLNKNPKIDIVGTGMKFFENRKGKNKVIENNDEIKCKLLFSNAINHPTVLAKREVFLNNKYDEKYLFAEDYELWCRIKKQTTFGNINIPLIKYRWHKEQISHTKREKQIHTLSKIHQNLLKELDFEISQDTLNIHSKIFLREYTYTLNFFKEIENHFKKILKGNKTKKIYEVKTLEKIIGELFFSIANNFITKRINVYKFYKESELSKFYVPKLSTKIFFKIKLFMVFLLNRN